MEQGRPVPEWRERMQSEIKISKEEMEAVERVTNGYQVGYAYLYPNEGIDRQEYVFDMTPENIANFIGSHMFDAQKIILTDMVDRLILDTAVLSTTAPIKNCASRLLQNWHRYRWERQNRRIFLLLPEKSMTDMLQRKMKWSRRQSLP